MIPVESGTPRAERELMLVHFITHITVLFARLPGLVGFSVQDRATLSAEREAALLDDELSVADVSMHTWPGVGSEAAGREIAATLLEFLDEHPSARRLLRGYAFARTFH